MDEILIGEQKYVSSKRAAELTGYAKDYIGQLCREGRVEARLVGRNWYVREAAIKDHRFGEENTLEVKIEPEKDLAVSEDNGKPLPTDSKEPEIPLEVEEDVEVIGGEGNLNIAEQMQEAWRDWFSQNSMALGEDNKTEEVSEALAPLEVQKEDVIVQEEMGAVPVTITQIEEEEPPKVSVEINTAKIAVSPKNNEPEATKREMKLPNYIVLKSFLALTTAFVVVLTVIGLGIFHIDTYTSYRSAASVANFLSGTGIYNK